MKITVILCTYNPRQDFLSRTLASLAAQSIPTTEWELIIIDNGSSEALDDRVDVSWHSMSRIIKEPKLGLMNARICGINHAKCDLLVFVDDDNVLRNDYLENALHIALHFPFLGSWGGSLLGEFETKPPENLGKYLNRLGIHKVQRFVYTTEYFRYDCIPQGAGMCIRRSLAKSYCVKVLKNNLLASLGRKGQDLACCEDTSMALHVIDQAYAIGKSPELVLWHLMPGWRLTIDYMKRLVFGDAKSNVLLKAARGLIDPHSSAPQVSILKKVWLTLRLSRTDYIMWKASVDGTAEGFRVLKKQMRSNSLQQKN